MALKPRKHRNSRHVDLTLHQLFLVGLVLAVEGACGILGECTQNSDGNVLVVC